MQHFFVTPSQVKEGRIYIEGSDVNHMKNVLRMRSGEELMISDGNNLKYRCVIEGYEEEEAVLAILESMQVDTELSSRIYLFQGLPKKDRMETVIEKAVELGVYEIIPVAMRYCVVKLDAKKRAAKVERWQKLAEAAAKQSKRSIIPKIHPVMEFKEAASYALNCDVRLVPYENKEGMEATWEAFDAVKPGNSISVMIGPEGGFCEEEIALVSETMRLVSLGKRILRTDTAGIAVLSMLMLKLEMR